MPEPVPFEPYDASDEKQVARQQRAAARREKALRQVVTNIMGNADGRAWMWGYLVSCHIFQPSFTPGDQYTTAYREGERNVGLKILADVMAAAPDQYLLMASENNG